MTWDVTLRIDSTLEDAKREFVAAVLRRHEGDKRKAAEQLGVSLRSLYAWHHRWGWRLDATS